MSLISGKMNVKNTALVFPESKVVPTILSAEIDSQKFEMLVSVASWWKRLQLARKKSWLQKLNVGYRRGAEATR